MTTQEIELGREVESVALWHECVVSLILGGHSIDGQLVNPVKFKGQYEISATFVSALEPQHSKGSPMYTMVTNGGRAHVLIYYQVVYVSDCPVFKWHVTKKSGCEGKPKQLILKRKVIIMGYIAVLGSDPGPNLHLNAESVLRSEVNIHSNCPLWVKHMLLHACIIIIINDNNNNNCNVILIIY